MAPAMGRRIVPLIWLSVARSGVSLFTRRPRSLGKLARITGAARGFRLPNVAQPTLRERTHPTSGAKGPRPSAAAELYP